MNSLNAANAAAVQQPSPPTPTRSSRYENQKRRDWNTFGQYLMGHHKPGTGPILLSQCNGSHVLGFLRYLDQFGKTKVHCPGCPFYGLPCPPAPCPCPLRQAWGSLDSLVGRLRAAYEENGGDSASNPFAARQVRLYLREVRDAQSKARGVSYDKKKRKQLTPPGPAVDSTSSDGSSIVVPMISSPSWASGAGHFWS
ncbi:hypothetical protein V2J09_020168 [Rumex salicifolius]